MIAHKINAHAGAGFRSQTPTFAIALARCKMNATCGCGIQINESQNTEHAVNVHFEQTLVHFCYCIVPLFNRYMSDH